LDLLADGNLAIVYQEGTAGTPIKALVVDSALNIVVPKFTVNTTTISGGIDSNVAVAALSSGGFAVTWQAQGGTGCSATGNKQCRYLLFYKADGTPSSAQLHLKGGDQEWDYWALPDIVDLGGKVALSYDGGGDAYTQIITDQLGLYGAVIQAG